MSLHYAAKHLASKGRGPDTELVHMTKDEVKGLQALAKAHGGEISVNPNTGLPEAGFLSNILPTIIGAGLTIASGGALSPLMAAGITGAGYGLVTGDLSKGLMAGLGAYGGAGLGSALAGAGTSAGLTAAGAEATAAGTTAGEAALQGPGYEAMKNAGLSDDLIRQSATDFAADNTGQVMRSTGAVQPSVLSGPHVQTANGIMGAPLESQGVAFTPDTQSAMSNPTIGGIKQLGSVDGMKNVYNAMPTGTMPALASTALTAMTPEYKQPSTDEYKGGQLANFRLSPNFKGSTPVSPNPYYKAQYANYVTNPYMAAEGGEVRMAIGGIAGAEQGTMFPQSQQDHTQFATSSQYPTQAMGNAYEPKIDPYTGQEMGLGMASGGIASFNGKQGSYLPRSSGADPGIFRDTDPTTARQDALEATMTQLGKRNKAVGLKAVPLPKARMTSIGDMADITAAAGGGTMRSGLGGYSDGGRMLKGPGDGMSDSIPATIGGKQPARLADGEFVVPADVVSHLGNGSTDAGAKKLYGMMDKIRKARTGKKKQAPAVKTDKYMPA